ncbi:uncharacterized protein BXZ73DRAFT_80482, partial [Epithele typhae]|uniref:uncharacterized protein n=1 Tax=Epithele typhae TaxID=378194 RepID=UPI002007E8D7
MDSDDSILHFTGSSDPIGGSDDLSSQLFFQSHTSSTRYSSPYHYREEDLQEPVFRSEHVRYQTPPPQRSGYSQIPPRPLGAAQQLSHLQHRYQVLRKQFDILQAEHQRMEVELDTTKTNYTGLLDALRAGGVVTAGGGAGSRPVTRPPLKDSDFPEVTTWYPHQWHKIRKTLSTVTDPLADLAVDATSPSQGDSVKSKRGGARAAKGINVTMRFVQDSDGEVVDGYRAKAMRNRARAIWSRFREGGRTMPATWGGARATVRTDYANEMEEAFPELRYGADQWKAHAIATLTYPNWHKRGDVDSDDEDSDDEQETTASRKRRAPQPKPARPSKISRKKPSTPPSGTDAQTIDLTRTPAPAPRSPLIIESALGANLFERCIRMSTPPSPNVPASTSIPDALFGGSSSMPGVAGAASGLHGSSSYTPPTDPSAMQAPSTAEPDTSEPASVPQATPPPTSVPSVAEGHQSITESASNEPPTSPPSLLGSMPPLFNFAASAPIAPQGGASGHLPPTFGTLHPSLQSLSTAAQIAMDGSQPLDSSVTTSKAITSPASGAVISKKKVKMSALSSLMTISSLP